MSTPPVTSDDGNATSQEVQLVQPVTEAEEVVFDYQEVIEVVPYSLPDEDGNSTDDDAENDDDETESPEWFGHCCVADHVWDFKATHKPSGAPPGSAASVIVRESLLWTPGQEIKYVFFGGTRNQQETVQRAMNEWMNYANIRFTNLSRDQVDKSDIRIAFNPKDGNWSRPGMAARDYKVTKPTLNLCGINEKVQATKEQFGVVLHEIGHVLGLKHEHQSPSLKGLITWIGHEVRNYFLNKCKWGDKQTQDEVIDLEDAKYLTNYTQFDLKSIMMYPMPKTTNMFGFRKKGITFPENNCLSDYDKAFIAIHYPYYEGNPNSPEWTFQRALEEVGCDETEIERAMKLFHSKKATHIRLHFLDIYYTVRVRKNLEVENGFALYD